jgi:hypothetical protein
LNYFTEAESTVVELGAMHSVATPVESIFVESTAVESVTTSEVAPLLQAAKAATNTNAKITFFIFSFLFLLNN